MDVDNPKWNVESSNLQQGNTAGAKSYFRKEIVGWGKQKAKVFRNFAVEKVEK